MGTRSPEVKHPDREADHFHPLRVPRSRLSGAKFPLCLQDLHRNKLLQLQGTRCCCLLVPYRWDETCVIVAWCIVACLKTICCPVAGMSVGIRRRRFECCLSSCILQARTLDTFVVLIPLLGSAMNLRFVFDKWQQEKFFRVTSLEVRRKTQEYATYRESVNPCMILRIAKSITRKMN